MTPSDPSGRRGWWIVAMSAVVIAMSGFGQTSGVSVFIDPMMETLGATRSSVSTAYLVGTLGGAMISPFLGRLIDGYGIRIALIVIGGCFAGVLFYMSSVVGVVTLAIGFLGIRMLGQGGMTLIGSIAPAAWFRRRLGFAISVTTASAAALGALVPVAITISMVHLDWRGTWAAAGVTILLVVIPIAVWGMTDGPERRSPSGRLPGSVEASVQSRAADSSFTQAQAMRTPVFWTIVLGSIVTSAIGTGLSFHQFAVLGEQGLSRVESAANFLPQTLGTLVAMLAVGALADRGHVRSVLVISMALFGLSMFSLQYVTPGLPAIAYGFLTGASRAGPKALAAATFPRFFGLTHLGAIRGFEKGIGNAASAFGPLGFSLLRNIAGSYSRALRFSLVLPLAVVLLAVFVRRIDPDPPARQ